MITDASVPLRPSHASFAISSVLSEGFNSFSALLARESSSLNLDLSAL